MANIPDTQTSDGIAWTWNLKYRGGAWERVDDTKPGFLLRIAPEGLFFYKYDGNFILLMKTDQNGKMYISGGVTGQDHSSTILTKEYGDQIYAEVFTDLDDVPPDYTGFGGGSLRINATEDGLEFTLSIQAKKVDKLPNPDANIAGMIVYQEIISGSNGEAKMLVCMRTGNSYSWQELLRTQW